MKKCETTCEKSKKTKTHNQQINLTKTEIAAVARLIHQQVCHGVLVIITAAQLEAMNPPDIVAQGRLAVEGNIIM